MGVMQARRVALAADEQAAEPLLQALGPPQRPGGALPPGRAEEVADMPRDALGRLVFSLLHAMLPGRLDDLQAPRVAGLVRQLRQRVTVALCCTVLTVPIAVWLLVRGVATYIATDSPGCTGPLRIWLLGFLMLQLGWPICMPSLALLLLGWCVGALLLLYEPRHCRRIQEFLVEASALQLVQAAMLLVAAMAALTARPLVRRLGDLLSSSGTDPEVIRHITVLLRELCPRTRSASSASAARTKRACPGVSSPAATVSTSPASSSGWQRPGAALCAAWTCTKRTGVSPAQQSDAGPAAASPLVGLPNCLGFVKLFLQLKVYLI